MLNVPVVAALDSPVADAGDEQNAPAFHVYVPGATQLATFN